MGFIVKVRDGCMFLLGMYMFDIFLILSCNVIVSIVYIEYIV